LTVQNDLTVTGDIMGRGRYVASNFDQLILTVSKTGSANPVDPIGDTQGSGDHFDSLYKCLLWASRRINASRLFVIVHAGTYTDWNANLVCGAGISELFIFGDGMSKTQVQITNPKGTANQAFNYNGTTLRLAGIHFTGNSSIRTGRNIQIGTLGSSVKAVTPTTSDQESVAIDAGDNTLIVGTFMIADGASYTKAAGATLCGQLHTSITSAQAIAGKIFMASGLLAYNLPAGQMNSSGWSQLPNGAILQYGTIAGAAPGQVITYPVAFKNAIYNLHVGYNGRGNPPFSAGQLTGGGLTSGSGNTNLVNFKLNAHSTMGLISWMAIGF
jgi:hypothetical protein